MAQTTEKTTTHFIFPQELLIEIDQLTGKRKRSAFVIEAAKEKLAKEKLAIVLRDAAGSWKDKNHPGLKTKKDVVSYVRKLRQESDKRFKDVL